MKTIILILSMLLSLTSCSDDSKSQEESILGTWKLIEGFGSDGANSQWVPVNNGHTYTFHSDGTIISDRFTCNGNYTLLSQNQIIITFDCGNSQFKLMYNVSFENQNLILMVDFSGGFSGGCDEGCGEKYEKIAVKG